MYLENEANEYDIIVLLILSECFRNGWSLKL